MATEDDNFDIDIYGDGGGYNANEQGPEDEMKHDDTELILDAPEPTQQQQQNGNPNHQGDGSSDGTVKPDSEGGAPHSDPVTQAGSANPQSAAKETPTPQQGTKRKEHDDRPTDPDATPALLISDLYWWTTDDDIRGWVCQADCEDELKDVTFSEHKVNGKSKGQAFLEFTTLQAATATKHKIESFSAGGQTRKHMVTYTSPQPNPFRTLPKDAPMRKDNQARSMSGGFNSPNPNMNFGGGMNNMGGGGGGYRGGRGGYNNRGGMSGGMGGGNFGGNRNFQNPMGGFQGPMVGGGFQGNPMGMQNYGGFNNRGGMMGGMRGGPGGMRGRGGGMAGPNMMGMPGMNPMGGMGMNAMPGAMNPMMGGMAGNMGMQGQGGFQGPNPAFNQGFFPPNQGVGDGSWNPHGAKRSRQE